MPSAGAEQAAGHCLEQVRRFDRDRYLTTLFAPAARRADLLALYAFNVEVARIRELVREPLMGHVRLQWWRDAIAEIYAGSERRHQVVQALAPAVRRHGLSRAHFDRLLDAREQDMSTEPPADLPALVAYAHSTAGSLGLLAVELLGGSAAPPPRAAADAAIAAAAARAWTAHALVGLLRAVPYHAHQHRIYLPQSLLAEHGVAAHDLLDLRPGRGLAAVAGHIATESERILDEPRRVVAQPPRPLAAAFLPATLARAGLAQLRRANYDPFDTRLQHPNPGRVWRLLWATLSGRY
jgi:phytoene synthase